MGEGIDNFVSGIKNNLKDGQEQNLEEFLAGRRTALSLAHANSDLADQAITQMLEHYLGDFKDDIAVYVLGGNGPRREVYPGSDTDITIICPERWEEGRKEAFEEAVGSFGRAMTDAGLAIDSPHPRTPAESAEKAQGDITIRTSLEDRRHLWGAGERAEALDAAMGRLPAKEFLDGKIEEWRERRGGKSGVEHLLFPNVKEGIGGLRDIHVMGWVSKAAGIGQGTLEDLVAAQVMTEAEKKQVEEAHEFIGKVRCYLHSFKPGNKGDKNAEILGPEEKVALARRMYGSGQEGDETQAIEAFMRDYIKHTRMIAFWCDIVVAEAVEKMEAENTSRVKNVYGYPPFSLRGGQMDFSGDGEPALIDMMRIFSVAQERGHPIHPFALRAMRRVSDNFNTELFDLGEAGEILRDILTRTHGTGAAFRRMQAVGMLLRLVPSYTDIDAEVEHKPWNVQSVDDHLFATLDCVNALENWGRDDAPVTTGVCQRITRDDGAGKSSRRILHSALLFSGTGKSGNSADYAARAVQNLRGAGARFHLSAEEIDEAAWLVENQNLMYETATLEDLDDPLTVGNFSRAVGSKDRLARLLVFTVARIMGGGQWENHRHSRFGMLYKETEKLLRGNGKEEPAISLRQDFNREATEVGFVAPAGTSAPLLRMTKVLSSKNLDIADARMFPLEGGEGHEGVVYVRTQEGAPCLQEDFKGIWNALAEALEKDDILDKKIPAAKRPKGTGGYEFRTDVDIFNKEGRRSTTVKVSLRQNEPYLLARMLEAIERHGMDVPSMKIQKEGVNLGRTKNHVQATDVFFVVDKETGAQVTDAERLAALKKDLLAILPGAPENGAAPPQEMAPA